MRFELRGEFITLQNLLKAENLVSSGGEAKMLIVDGNVFVNGEVEIRRGKKLVKGDVVKFDDNVVEII